MKFTGPWEDLSPNFDVLFVYSFNDMPQVEAIAEVLKQRGLKPWLDKDQIQPGRFFQGIIQEAISNVKSAAIFIGPKGLGKWQALELRSFITQILNKGIPVIPVLLPGVTKLPSELLFLQEMTWVRFNEGIADAEALDNLIWGITGKRPR